MSNKSAPLYRVIKAAVRLGFPKIRVEGAENLPPEPAVLVGNHCQMNGPIAWELYAPRPRYTWCAGQMMRLKEVPAYAYADFWSVKPRRSRWLYKIASYLIAPLSVCVFNNARTIPVYRDARVLTTFRESVQRLQEGADLVVFPEHAAPYNAILCDFQDRFIDLARMYYRKTGRALCFVPAYLAPSLKTLVLGRPIRFRPEAPMKEERERICRELMEAITALALALPRHRVVPYRNLPKRDYPWSKEASEL